MYRSDSSSRGWISFQIRAPLPLKEQLVALSRRTGRSQQSIVIEALQAYFTHWEMPPPWSAPPASPPLVGADGDMMSSRSAGGGKPAPNPQKR